MAPSPTFSLYRLLTGVLGGRYGPVPLGQRFEFDVDRIVETAIGSGREVVVLNSPNNPTGSVLPEGAVERILAETGALVVCDEAYQDFGGPTALPLLRRTRGSWCCARSPRRWAWPGCASGWRWRTPRWRGSWPRASFPTT